MTTHWSVVLVARGADVPGSEAALEQLCRDYWRPLYAYVRRRGHRPGEAEDLVQSFFERFLSRHYLGDLTPGMGRFRTFLLSCLSHFLSNERDRTQAQKRGGGQVIVSLDDTSAGEPIELECVATFSPEAYFDRQWAMDVLGKVIGRLRTEFRATEKRVTFEDLEPFLLPNPPAGKYPEVALRTGLKEGTVKVAVHRLRRRYGELLRRELIRTVSAPEEVEDEIRYLLQALSASP